MLYECDVEYIELHKELEHLENYIELEKIRYDDRVIIKKEIKGNTIGHEITPLILLPFIENAFKHGVSSHSKGARVDIDIEIENGKLNYVVENSLPENENTDQRETVAHGIGLNNIKKRLKVLYPQHSLKIKKDETFKATLVIPLKS